MRDVADMPRESFPHRTHRTYRPALIERPSMTQCVVLSVLVHILVVALFGDATGTGTGRRASSAGIPFLASLQPPSSASRRVSPLPPTRTTDAVVPINAPTTPEPTDAPTAIKPLAVLAVEVDKPIGDFVVPSLNIESLPVPVAAIETTIAAIPKLVALLPVPISDRSFAGYVVPSAAADAVIPPAPTASVPPPAAVGAESKPKPKPDEPVPADTQRRIDAEISTPRSESGKAAAPAASATSTNGSQGNVSSLLSIVPNVPKPAPRLDLDSLRLRSRQITAESAGSRAVPPFSAAVQEAPKRNIEKIFDKALKRPDCKDEYAGMGLAAVVPLVRDALKDDGCKW